MTSESHVYTTDYKRTKEDKKLANVVPFANFANFLISSHGYNIICDLAWENRAYVHKIHPGDITNVTDEHWLLQLLATLL